MSDDAAADALTAPGPAVAWDDALLQDPHHVADKQRRVQRMFAAIAPSYDLNNRLHSLGIDQLWRRKAVRLSQVGPTDRIVDVACGTGDLTMQYASALYWSMSEAPSGPLPKPGQVLGIDYTREMLPIARQKADRTTAPLRGFPHPILLGQTVRFVNGDAQRLPLPDASADVVSIAFGIRNVADPALAISDFHRVLRPGGRVIILEFSLPTNPLLRALYNFYFRKILPRTATLISGDKSGAYKYLPESVNTFIGREQMTQMMTQAGFEDVTQHAMTFGVCICYRGVKTS